MLTRFWRRFVHFGKRVGWGKVGLGAGAVVLVLLVGRSYFFSPAPSAAIDYGVPQVEVRSVAELASQGSPLSLAGVVSSQAEATVLAQSSGAVTAVYRSLGNYVGAGTIVAELESSSQRAAVLQAQGSVAAATAALSKVQGPSRPEQLTILQAAVDSANSGAVNALLSAYSAVDSAVKGTADTMISNPDSATPQFNIFSNDQQLSINISNMRVSIGATLARERARANTLSSSDNLQSEIVQTTTDVRATRMLLDAIISALGNAITANSTTQATIAADLAAATAARTALTTALSSLSSAGAAITNAKAALTEGNVGGASPDVAAAEAQLTVAQGGLAAARANLEKAIIRAPISGTINSFSLKVGDYVSQQSPVLTVANNSALEITAYITEQDAPHVTVGSSVTIEGGTAGVITHVAPALDPATKKIEVRIGVTKNAGLINGQSVLINLPHTNTSVAAAAGPISIPISAIKVGASGVHVFTVEGTTLVAHAVTLGELLGDKVVIIAGITPDMLIVSDARGLYAGQTVEVRS